MIDLVCKHCGGRLAIDESKAILDETSAQLVQTLICDYCGNRYAMGEELLRAPKVSITQSVNLERVDGILVGVAVHPNEESGEVNLDQRMDIGEVHGVVIGAQIGAGKTGQLSVEQNVDLMDGVLIGGMLGVAPSRPELETILPQSETVSIPKTAEAKKKPWWRFWEKAA